MVNIAIIGSGFIGDIHASIYQKIKDANVVAFTDVNKESAKLLSEKYKTEYYVDNDNIFKNEDIDCVDICTPPYLHAELSLKAAESKKNIFCEKALALNLADADKVIAAIKRNKIKAMAGHVLRFWPEYIKTKEILDSGELGAPLNIACHRLITTPDWNDTHWWLDESKSGGIAAEVLIHDLDVLIWFLGKPKYVKALGNFDKNIGGYYHLGALVDFENNCKGMAEAGWGFKGKFPFTAVLRVLCEKGSIEWQLKAGKNIEDRPFAPLKVYRDDGKEYTPDVIKEDAFILELKYFIDCIVNDDEIKQSTFEDSRNALELALAAKESALKNKTVHL